jgi:AcrR family transcriptional regulator
MPPRPRKRGRRPKTHTAVLAATSELLKSVSLAELSVAQILAAAAVGRTSFYEHFSSKDDVVVKLVRSISVEMAEAIEPMFDRGTLEPEQAFGEGLTSLMEISARYAPLLVAAIEEWPAVPELRQIWFSVQGALTVRLAETIDRDRAAGIAPAGAESEPLAASLVWTAERAFHVAMTGDHPTLVDQNVLVEPLVQLFVGTIYGRPVSRIGRGRLSRW